jgi:hypothetical protein
MEIHHMYNNRNSRSGGRDAETPRAVPLIRTMNKKQSRATLIADGLAVKAKWKTLIKEASELWPRVPAEELAKVDGSFPRLAGLIQLRYGASREQSDAQVTAFFAKHYPAPAAAAPIILAPAPAPAPVAVSAPAALPEATPAEVPPQA